MQTAAAGYSVGQFGRWILALREETKRETQVGVVGEEAEWRWLAAALLAHTLWGAHPVLSRYLQTVSGLPSMSLLFIAYVVPLILIVTLYRRKLRFTLFASPVLWAFALIVAVRAITNMLAARYTLSIYVQLVTQATPFLVVLLGRTLFAERIPRYTGWAIALCLGGALLMMGGNIGQVESADLRQDWLGIALAFASALSLAFYMLVARRTASVQGDVAIEVVIVVQTASAMVVALVASWLGGEEWGRWLMLRPVDWVAFAGLSLGVFLTANVAQLAALRHLGAPLVSSIMAWRLVSALVLGALVLDERLQSVWQVFGAAVVLVTITWYLSRAR